MHLGSGPGLKSGGYEIAAFKAHALPGASLLLTVGGREPKRA